jgi:hypothetical protein
MARLRRAKEVSGSAQEPLGGADDQGERVLGERIVPQAGQIELIEDETLDGFRREPGQEHRVGDAGADLLVDRERERLHERRPADQDEVVTAREVLEEEAQLPQAVGLHEVGVVDDGHEHLAGAMQAERLLHEQSFALAVAAVELDLEGFAEDAQGFALPGCSSSRA